MKRVDITASGSEIQGNSDPITAFSLPIPRNVLIDRAYLHVPFCFHKCHYCDFYSIVDARDRRDAFARRLADEIRAAGPRLAQPLRSIFIGGGTPTLLDPEHWSVIGQALHDAWNIVDGTEFTVEANPETVTPEGVEALRACGVNRVSVGAQSFDPRHLDTLERHHDPASVGRSVEILRRGGITRINLDLIFGIPGQTIEDWARDLDAALSLQPEHLSCYGLTYEPGTAMTARRDRGRIQPIDESIEADMFLLTRERLHAAGFDQYEISNWARPGAECSHNLGYWRNESWWALGPSAAAHVDGWRWRNVGRLTPYLESNHGPPIEEVECVAPSVRVGELLMLGLRLREGVARSDLDAWLEVEGAAWRRDVLADHQARGRLEWVDQRLRLTDHGLLMANEVISDLL